ncbi:molybdopterin-binding protein [Jannaschia sp. S6380]|uniref:molybdopterin-binding protein n=1 Tax=Jannaschia sp. S6380 TaxID=2926408 RepID=UPI001FF17A87|nr:molybdopterin-binding protein [Jannaschia sp. S6380]MCK0167154.1 molybdopterin-binding protein [Jannaschia sp. S6380]
MRFGPVPLDRAEGAVLAHSVALPDGRLRKGKILTRDAIDRLRGAGLTRVTVARLDPGDVPENAAAARLAHALAGRGLTVREAATGRANLHADGPGILAVDGAAITAANVVDPLITIATLPPWQRVAAGTMAATVKIISYAVGADRLAEAMAAATAALSLCPPVIGRAALIVTTLPGGATASAAVTTRLDRMGVACDVHEVPHDVAPLAAALQRVDAPLRLILTASATSDLGDVAPAALRRADGTVTRFGMPVDPGNLMMLGKLDGAHVVGLPGCARSPALNGADWILERAICGIPVTDAEIAAMGVGGLLKEIPTRPQLRDPMRPSGSHGKN